MTSRPNSSWAVVYLAVILAWLWAVSAICAAFPQWQRTVWAVAIVPPAIIVIWRRAKYRRNVEGSKFQCNHCGYDLTGNVSGACPECGTPVGKDAEG